jgi:hypothetical protein|tara:strand:+ start:402 stop:1151 length:750 start_codon:yes stop_codon:yes gene_type:complete
MFTLPKSLYPFYNQVDKTFSLPNVAVGRVKLKSKSKGTKLKREPTTIIPVFSAFFSHASFLKTETWKLITYPAKSDHDKPMHVFVDPATLYVIGSSIVNFYSDPSLGSDIALAVLTSPRPIEIPSAFSPRKPPSIEQHRLSHWNSVGQRYQEFYTVLKDYSKTLEEKAQTSKQTQDDLHEKLQSLTIQDIIPPCPPTCTDDRPTPNALTTSEALDEPPNLTSTKPDPPHPPPGSPSRTPVPTDNKESNK